MKLLRGSFPEIFEAVRYGSGSGDGYGYGDGSGYGYGNGSGAGSGSGYGSGSGSGYGSGYGSGDGDGDGDGYGDGYGYGYGYGDGDGDGFGEQIPWHTRIGLSIPKWTDEQQNRFKTISALDDCALVLWKSRADGTPANGGSGEAARPGLRQKIPGPLKICTANALHGTMNPDAWKGDRVWVVALFGQVVWQEDKCAALEREIIGEVL